MVGRPNSDEEDLVRNVALQARDMASRALAMISSRSPSPLPPSSPRPPRSAVAASGLSPSHASTPPPLSHVSQPHRLPSRPTPSYDPLSIKGQSPSQLIPSRRLSPPKPTSPRFSSPRAAPPLQEPTSPAKENSPLLPDMSEKAKQNAKGKGGPGSTSDIGTMLPLLFAAHPGWVPNYRRMSELDSYGRTTSQLEHKFRTWRKDGATILAKNPEIAEALKAAGDTPKKRAPKGTNAKAKKTPTDVGEDEDEADGHTGGVSIKQENDVMADTENEMTLFTSNGKTKTTKVKNGINSSKKRASDRDTDADNEETPAKKAKVIKRGIAKVVKKTGAKAREIEVTDDEEGSEATEETKFKPEGKGKGKPRATPKAKAMANFMNKSPIKKRKVDCGSQQDTTACQADQEARKVREEDAMTEMKFGIEI